MPTKISSLLLLKFRLIFVLLLFCLVPMLGIGIYSYNEIKKELMNTYISNLDTILKMKKHHIENFFSIVQNDIDTLSKSPYIINLLSYNKPNTINNQEFKQMTDKQLSLFISTRNIMEIVIIDNNKNIILSTSQNANQSNDECKKIYTLANNLKYISEVEYNNKDNIFFITIAQPVIYETQLLGMIIAKININSLFDLIQDYSGMGLSGETLIGTKKNNQILFLNPLRNDNTPRLTKIIDANSTIAYPMRNALEANTNNSQKAVDYRGEIVIASWSYLPSLKWGIVAKINRKEAISSLQIIQRSISTTAFIFFVFSIFFSFYIAKKIINPVKQIEEQANHDFLTGLPNRALLYKNIMETMIYAQKNNNLIALLFLDLDGFKCVNDTYGHQIGDELLKNVAQRLLSLVKISDTVSRLGGDEFVVLLYDVKNKENTQNIATRIKDTISQPYTIDGNILHIGTSIGISIYPNDVLHFQGLIESADNAMYQAKKSGKNKIIFACDLAQ